MTGSKTFQLLRVISVALVLIALWTTSGWAQSVNTDAKTLQDSYERYKELSEKGLFDEAFPHANFIMTYAKKSLRPSASQGRITTGPGRSIL